MKNQSHKTMDEIHKYIRKEMNREKSKRGRHEGFTRPGSAEDWTLVGEKLPKKPKRPVPANIEDMKSETPMPPHEETIPSIVTEINGLLKKILKISSHQRH